MIDRININGVTYSATALEAGAQATGITITVDGVTYLLGDVIAPMTEQAAPTEASGNIDKISVNGVVYDIRDVEDVAAERKRAMQAEGEIRNSFSEELGREIDARMFADNDIRRKGVLFGGFSNRQTTANEVVIGYKDIDQKNEGTFTIPAATTEKAGVMSAADKKKLDGLSPGGGGGGGDYILPIATADVLGGIKSNSAYGYVGETPFGREHAVNVGNDGRATVTIPTADNKNYGVVKVDNSVNSESNNPVSGKAVADAIANIGGGGGDITATPTEEVIEEIEPTLVSTAIRKTPQVLTDGEKEIARENIGAVGFSDLTNAIAEAITNTLNTAV